MIKWYENIVYELQIPMILIDIPYKNDYETDDISVRYIQSQFDDAIRKLEGITGKTFSMERFNEVCEISQRTGKAWLKAVSLGVWFHIVARLVYSKPWMAFFLAELIAAILVLFGAYQVLDAWIARVSREEREALEARQQAMMAEQQEGGHVSH